MSQAYQPDSKKNSAKKLLAAPSNTPRHRILLRLLSYLKPYWWALILVIIGFAINAATEIWIAKLLQYISLMPSIKTTKANRIYFHLLLWRCFLSAAWAVFWVITIRHWCRAILFMSYAFKCSISFCVCQAHSIWQIQQGRFHPSLFLMLSR